jgi:hypothetical protein
MTHSTGDSQTAILSLFFFLSLFCFFLLFFFSSVDADGRLILCNYSVLAYVAVWDWWATYGSFTP